MRLFILTLALFVTLTGCGLRGKQPLSDPGTLATDDPSGTHYLSVVFIYSTAETSYPAAGLLRLLPDHTLSGYLFTEDARDTTPLPSIKYHNEMEVAPGFKKDGCKPGPILLPSFMSHPVTVAGKWTMTESDILLELKQPDELRLSWSPESTARDFVLKDVAGYQNAVGYAFLSTETPLRTAPLKDSDLDAAYEGYVLQNNANDPLAPYKAISAYTPYPAGDWKTHSVQADSDVRSITLYVNDGASQYGQYAIARNVPGLAPHMMFEAFGHDFNNDGCFNAQDAGHSRLQWGVTVRGQIVKFLILESSYQTGGRLPILSVGKVNMKGASQ